VHFCHDADIVDAVHRQCLNSLSQMPARPMLPKAMLALRQCRGALRVYDAVRRPCCPLDNAGIAPMPSRPRRVRCGLETVLALRQCRGASGVYDAVWRPCCHRDNADYVNAIKPGGVYDAVHSTMLTVCQCRFADAAWRQCCHRENAISP
jgi:hypothetical protein